VTRETPLARTRHGSTLVVTIDRPGRGNALSRATLSEFARLREEVESDESLRALVITGAGDKVFCAGADLKERRGMTDDQIRDQLQAYRVELGWLEECALPVVAAINGAALGGGAELALLCDLRIAVARASFGFPETSLGVIPGAGGTQRLPRIIGEARAKELILLGRRIDAPTALDWGLIHHIADPNVGLLQATLSWIEPISSGAPIALHAAKEALAAARSEPLPQGLRRELDAYERCLTSEDRIEALAAFAEKRKPVFKGR
jgi:enoyl-CoA hydratase/carnithine racemase